MKPNNLYFERQPDLVDNFILFMYCSLARVAVGDTVYSRYFASCLRYLGSLSEVLFCMFKFLAHVSRRLIGELIG